jgi:hypothetical protein
MLAGNLAIFLFEPLATRDLAARFGRRVTRQVCQKDVMAFREAAKLER